MLTLLLWNNEVELIFFYVIAEVKTKNQLTISCKRYLFFFFIYCHWGHSAFRQHIGKVLVVLVREPSFTPSKFYSIERPKSGPHAWTTSKNTKNTSEKEKKKEKKRFEKYIVFYLKILDFNINWFINPAWTTSSSMLKRVSALVISDSQLITHYFISPNSGF